MQLQHRSFPVTAILFFLKFEAPMVIKLLNQCFHSLFFLSSVMTPAPEVDQTFKVPEKELMERLQRCQKEHRDLDLMLHSHSRSFTFSELRSYCVQTPGAVCVRPAGRGGGVTATSFRWDCRKTVGGMRAQSSASNTTAAWLSSKTLQRW